MVQSENKYSYILWNLFKKYVYSKRNKCSFCCFLNQMFCFCKSRVVRWVNIPFVPLFVFIVEIVMKVSNNETVLLRKKVNYEDNNEKKKSPKHLLEWYLLLSSSQTNTHTRTHTHTHTHTHSYAYIGISFRINEPSESRTFGMTERSE